MANVDLPVGLKIPAGFLMETFVCPICLGDMTSVHITSCGHNFCENCIRECLNRRHICPLCNAETTQEQLIKNHAFENLFQRVKEEKDNAAKDYVQSQINQSRDDGSDGMSAKKLSPIEKVFQKHAKVSLLAYGDYYRDLENTFNQSKSQLQTFYGSRLEEYRAKMNVVVELPNLFDEKLDIVKDFPNPSLERTTSKEQQHEKLEAIQKEYQEKVTALKTRFDHSVQLLVDSYDQYMSSIAPSPFLLPVKCTVVIPGKNILFDVSLRMTDTIYDIRKLLFENRAKTPDPLTSFGKDVKFWIKRPLVSLPKEDEEHKIDPLLEEVKDENTSVSELKLIQGTQIHIIGTLIFKSNAPKKCFTLTYKKGEDQRIDYYRCKDCKFNWICKPCMESCHQGHNLIAFMLNHKPSYGCCYCPRKRTCKIENKRSKKRK